MTDPNLTALLGRIFVHQVTGEKGRLVETPEGFAMERVDRGETYQDRIMGRRGLNANWALFEVPAERVLRDEEIARVAWAADKTLRALERHEPFKFYELDYAPAPSWAPHDPGLVAAIRTYLTERSK